jgi:uncharacterized protein YndB with AHSA1/START domain
VASINDQISINTTSAKAYQALTQQAGYRGWWNKVAEVPEAVGGEAKLCFDKQGTIVNMRFRIDEMKPNESVRWTCTGHDMPAWVNTTLHWSIDAAGDATLVRLDHAGWPEPPAQVADGWKHFLSSLKSYLETGTGQPW